MRYHTIVRRAYVIPGAILLLIFVCCGAAPAHGQETKQDDLHLPPEAALGLQTLYGGDPAGAMEIFQKIAAARPNHPLGYMLEAEAQWWKLYCLSLEFKWNQLDVWRRES
ncbi:MAG: hypothetical protein ACRD5L_14935, partial [Bryobacteraceae bacterium]